MWGGLRRTIFPEEGALRRVVVVLLLLLVLSSLILVFPPALCEGLFPLASASIEKGGQYRRELASALPWAERAASPCSSSGCSCVFVWLLAHSGSLNFYGLK